LARVFKKKPKTPPKDLVSCKKYKTPPSKNILLLPGYYEAFWCEQGCDDRYLSTGGVFNANKSLDWFLK